MWSWIQNTPCIDLPADNNPSQSSCLVLEAPKRAPRYKLGHCAWPRARALEHPNTQWCWNCTEVQKLDSISNEIPNLIRVNTLGVHPAHHWRWVLHKTQPQQFSLLSCSSFRCCLFASSDRHPLQEDVIWRREGKFLEVEDKLTEAVWLAA